MQVVFAILRALFAMMTMGGLMLARSGGRFED
jgi:hypothetical protein